MEYVYAALLLHKLGKEITAENIDKVIKAAGGVVDEAKAKALVASLKGVDIEKVMAMPIVPATGASGVATPAHAEEKKKEEEKAEATAEGLSALFG